MLSRFLQKICSILTDFLAAGVLVIGQPSNVFLFQLVFISGMVTLSSCLIWQIISFILPPNEYGCLYAWTTLGSGLAIDLQKMPILQKKNYLFRWNSFWSGRVCKHTKLSHLGPAYIEKLTHPKRVTFWCGFWSRGIIDCHLAEATLDVLRPVFEEHIINRRADVVWPPRSCDLTPLDYYLWCQLIKDNCRFKGQYSWSHWWNTAAHNR